MQLNLAFIYSNYDLLVSTIAELEKRRLPLQHNLSLVEKLPSVLEKVQGAIGRQVFEKCTAVLSKNPGWDTVRKINKVFSGEQFEKPDDWKYDVTDMVAFKYAPLTSCDTERSFSAFKNTLSDKRTSLTVQHIKMHLVIRSYSLAVSAGSAVIDHDSDVEVLSSSESENDSE